MLHVSLGGVALLASAYLFNREGTVYSVYTVNLVDLVSETGGMPPAGGKASQAPGGEWQTEDILKPEPKKALTEAPAKENPQELRIPPLEQKKQGTRSREQEVDPKPQTPNSSLKKEEIKPPAPETKETPKVKEETLPGALKPQPKPRGKELATKGKEQSAPTPKPQEEEALTAEEIRQKRLSQLAGPLLDKQPPPVPTREPTPIPREALFSKLQSEEEDFSRNPQGEESLSGRRGGTPGSASLELEGTVQQGSAALVGYVEVVTRTIKGRWLPPSGRGRGLIEFTISKNGEVSEVHIVRSSGDKSLDQSILRAVEESNPLPELPPELQQELDRLNDSFLRVRLHFGRRLS